MEESSGIFNFLLWIRTRIWSEKEKETEIPSARIGAAQKEGLLSETSPSQEKIKTFWVMSRLYKFTASL